MAIPKKRSKPAENAGLRGNRPDSTNAPPNKIPGTAKSRRVAKGQDAAEAGTHTEETTMPEATLEQRLEWLQTGLREIGKMCLQLGGNGTSSPAAPANPRENAIPQVQPTAAPSVPVPGRGDGVRWPNLAGGTRLSDFLENIQDLTTPERLEVVKSAIAMLGQVFAHLPLKRAMHGIDPIQKLRLLEQRLNIQIAGNEPEEDARPFHDEMIEIFHSLRDLHTNYILPASYRGKVAYLPFLIQEYFDGDPPRRHYVVTRLQPGFNHPKFKERVEVTHWNGIPIDRAVALNAAREAGSNADARHARGLESLSLRAMDLAAPPDEEWVIIGYLSGGQKEEFRFEWKVTTPMASSSGSDVNDAEELGSDTARSMGFDAEAVTIQRTKKTVFFPEEIGREQRMAQVILAASGTAPDSNMAMAGGGVSHEELRRLSASSDFGSALDAQECMSTAAAIVAGAHSGPLAGDDPELTSLLPDFFSFRAVTTPSGKFGYIRIFSFMARNANAFLAEFVRMAALLPQNGLIIDLRGNGGGNILAGEQLLQVLTDRKIEPERFHFINSSSTRTLCKGNINLMPWLDSIDLSVQTGETYSQGFPLTTVDQANSIGRRYPGKSVLIIDALCYSTTDIFTAGFQDHEIGKILGTSGRTGAGGANVWTYDFFSQLPDFNPLPKGLNFRTAIRRSTRTGARAGVPLEDLGVKPDARHYLTLKDLFENNVDLIAKAATLL